MKKIYLSIICLIVISQTFFSCNNSFLDEKNYSSYAPTTLADSLGFQSSLGGLYTQMSYWETYSNNQGWVSVWHRSFCFK